MFRKIALATFALALVLFGALSLSVPQALAGPPGPSIVNVAIAANAEGGAYEGVFDTLIAALMAADESVINTLSGNGQFTVFAPTDAAFAELGFNADNIDSLDQGTLTQILLYHVARGRRDSEDVLGSSRIRTLQRGFLFQNDGTLTDALGREADIIVTDVYAANGIIHAIDAVVLPFAP